MSSHLANVSPSSPNLPESEEPLTSFSLLATTLDVVQFDPSNSLHFAKAPSFFRSVQGRFADAAQAGAADIFTFADQCIFVGMVVHDPLAWSRLSGRPVADNDMDIEQECEFAMI